MKTRCLACDTDDIPETTDLGLDATARDHLRIWHPDEWFTADMVDGVLVLYPSDSDTAEANPDPSQSDDTGRSLE